MTVEVLSALSPPFHPNGSTASFDFSFKIGSVSEVEVLRLTTAGATTVESSSLYSVSLASDGEGGTITYHSPPASSTDVLYAHSNPSFAQLATFTNGGFLPSTLNPAIDRAASRDLWLKGELKRAFKIPFGEAALTLPAAPARANMVLGFDGFGFPVAVTQVAGAQGAPGANVMAIGAWSAFETTAVPTGTDLVQTADTLVAGSTVGTASARYKLDAEQTTFTAKMQAYIDASHALGTPTVDAELAMTNLQKLWRRKSLNNRWFTLAEPEPWTGQFGCPGDGGQDYTNAMSGTDVFFQLQGFIDYCVYFSKLPGKIGQGTHRVSRGLQHGYGHAYIGGQFRGPGTAFAGESTLTGACIVCDTTEDPILNITGDRAIVWEGVTFLGKYMKFLFDTVLCVPANAPAAGYDCYNPLDWHDPSLRSSQNGRFNPYALVTLGAYDTNTDIGESRPTAATFPALTTITDRECHISGGNVYLAENGGVTGASGPTGTGNARGLQLNGTVWYRYLGAHDAADFGKYTAYREPYKPAWLMNPATSAYTNRNYGSFATFRDCTFYAGRTLLVCKPSMNALQDDFLQVERCSFSLFGFAFSAGNHQFRTGNFHACSFGLGECNFIDNIHGNRSGSFKNMHVDTCGFGESVDIFRVAAGYGEPMKFTCCYSEAQCRLGQVLAGGFSQMGPQFDSCEWGLAGIDATRGRAGRHLYGTTDPAYIDDATVSQGELSTVFINTRINVDSVFTCFLPGALFINSNVYAYDRGGQTISPYLAHFANATAAGLILQGLEYRRAPQRLLFAPHNVDTGAQDGSQIATAPGYLYGDRPFCIPAMVKSVRARNGAAYEELAVPHEGPFILGKTGGVTVSFPGADATEIKIVWTGTNQAEYADRLGFGPGSILLDGQTGTVWAVRYYDDGTDTLYGVAQNNFKVVSGVRSFVQPVSTSSGNMAILHARNYTPALPLFGDFVGAVTATGTNGSPNLTSVAGKLVPGQVLTHANIPAGTTVREVSGTTAVMTANATGAVSGSIVASTTISNVGTSAGDGSTLTTLLPVGDYLVSPQELRAYAPATAKISSRSNGSPGSIVLDQAATKSANDVRLGFFRRPCPANV